MQHGSPSAPHGSCPWLSDADPSAPSPAGPKPSGSLAESRENGASLGAVASAVVASPPTSSTSRPVAAPQDRRRLVVTTGVTTRRRVFFSFTGRQVAPGKSPQACHSPRCRRGIRTDRGPMSPRRRTSVLVGKYRAAGEPDRTHTLRLLHRGRASSARKTALSHTGRRRSRQRTRRPP